MRTKQASLSSKPVHSSVSIHCVNDGKSYCVSLGTTVRQLYEQIGLSLPYAVVCAKVNNKTEPLSYAIFAPKQIEFVDIIHPSARRVYIRSLCFILSKAVADVFPGVDISIEHPISKGYYCSVSGLDLELSKEVIDKIKQRMLEIVELDIPFIQKEAPKTEVANLFRIQKMMDKVTLLDTLDSLYAKYSELDEYQDYFYGTLAYSTSQINLFDLVSYQKGMLLRIPDAVTPDQLAPIVEQEKMFEAYQHKQKLQDIIHLRYVGDLNRTIEKNHISTVINISEAYQEKKIANIADQIADKVKRGLKLVLIAGPSSSGKTTFRKRLEIQLLVNGIKPLGISLDDYFVNREDTPLDDNGEYDFESLHAINLPQLNGDLETLFSGGVISVPTFNFNTGKQEFNGHRLQMDADSVLILEGIHGLNPLLTEYIPKHQKFSIYVSALTTISLDNHNWISTTDNRLLRRIIRDARDRGFSATDTIARWESVRRGEEKWIFPFQENADVMFNSAMMYEFAALKTYAEPVLQTVLKTAPEYAEAYRLLRFLSYFKSIGVADLPSVSLLREFVGGSNLK